MPLAIVFDMLKASKRRKRGRKTMAEQQTKRPDYWAPTASDTPNPLGLRGIGFVQFATSDPAQMDGVFKALGCSRLQTRSDRKQSYYRQRDIHFVIDEAESGFERAFAEQHGPSICAMGWRVDDPQQAFAEALRRGAQAFEPGKIGAASLDFPAIFGIGDSILFFIPNTMEPEWLEAQGFKPLPENSQHPLSKRADIVPDLGFVRIDHLTNNVYKGTMDYWAHFYKDIFGFTEVRYFDIKGEQTGLTSFALRSPDGSFSIPINQGNESKSQIEEYLRDYHGPGVQHLALLTEDLPGAVESLKADTSGHGIETLDIKSGYYQEAFQRVPQVTEDREQLQRLNLLVDGDPEGYLLQIFTRNLFGPIFFELIQRKNHHAFGEGNFTALFESIERDQARRGVL
jgi:4-hydroxyphenylpyruvate dioxygenase